MHNNNNNNNIISVCIQQTSPDPSPGHTPLCNVAFWFERQVHEEVKQDECVLCEVVGERRTHSGKGHARREIKSFTRDDVQLHRRRTESSEVLLH